MTRPNVIFDIGGVLVEWQPHLAWLDAMGSRGAVDAFMARIDFPARNLRADGGETFADLALELPDADDRRHLAAYVDHYPLTLPRLIDGSWALLDQLRAGGARVHAITNWSAETWPRGLTRHPRLAEVFETLVVSGLEGITKPDPRIFALLCDRADVAPDECVFIDDSAQNVAAARSVGMDAIHFTTPAALRAELVTRGLL